MQPSETNQKGYFESAAIWELHNVIMPAIGVSWDDWFSLDDGWMDSTQGIDLLDRAVALLEQEFGQSRFFVFKDPRICRLNAFWERALQRFGARPLYIMTHRSPLEVAASLSRRDELHPRFGQLLWLRYTLDAEFATRGKPRTFTSYGRLMDRGADILSDLETALDMRFPKRTAHAREAVEDFLERDLRHFNDAESGSQATRMTAPWVVTTFNIMERWVASGEDAGDYAALDQARDGLDCAESLFGPLITDGRNIRKTLKTVDSLKADTRQAALDLADERKQAERTAARDKAAMAALDQRLAESDRSLYDMECRVSVARTEARESRDEALSAKKMLDIRNREIITLTRKLVEAEERAVAQSQPAALVEDPRIAELTRQKAELATRIGELEKYIVLTQQTLSWRVTKPLRAVRRLLGKR